VRRGTDADGKGSDDRERGRVWLARQRRPSAGGEQLHLRGLTGDGSTTAGADGNSAAEHQRATPVAANK
jgi:hypothetical protein